MDLLRTLREAGFLGAALDFRAVLAVDFWVWLPAALRLSVWLVLALLLSVWLVFAVFVFAAAGLALSALSLLWLVDAFWALVLALPALSVPLVWTVFVTLAGLELESAAGCLGMGQGYTFRNVPY